MKKRICHITSFLEYSLYIEAIAAFLDEEKYDVTFIFLNPRPGPLQEKLAAGGHHVEWIKYRGKKDLPSAIWQLRKLFSRIKPDVVHTHLVDASLAGLIAARLSGIKSRMHTRHHSTECHVYYPHGVYYDKLINSFSTGIIATTQIVKDTLIDLENADPKKIHLLNL